MKIEDIFNQAATTRGVKPDSYKNEIAAVIDICYNSNDPKILEKLNKLFPTKPTPQEFVSQLIIQTISQNENE